MTFSWSRQSDDVLVGWNQGRFYYQDIFGDINIFKNIIGGKRSTMMYNGESVAVTDLLQGWQLGIGETFYVRSGSFIGTGNRDFSTSGIGFRFSGLFKLIENLNPDDNKFLASLIGHFDARYDHSYYTASGTNKSLDRTSFNSICLIYKF